jgi:hypothetical protein
VVGHLPRRLSTPRAAALAGVLFALLFGTALTLIRTALPHGAEPGAQWLDDAGTRLQVAAILAPFAGIAFLWFIGVVRDGLGRYEDRFFATVFLGSGLLFLAMMFASFGIGAALVASRGTIADPATYDAVVAFGGRLMLVLAQTYALRMAGVFMFSLSTIWLRTRLMPRWLVIVSYVAAVALLFASEVSMWTVLAFPLWVLLVSVLLLVRATR